MINTQLAPQLIPKGESYMPTHLVNLDALIQREDFEVASELPQSRKPFFKLEELERGRLAFSTLRKPDFQRETSNWKPEMIVEFVKSFLDGELIPFMIMWHSTQSGKVFVIDGAHRISALIAWVNDDYGDGDISKPFFDHKIPLEQERLAKQTRDLIEKEIGAYKTLHRYGLNEKEAPSQTALRRGRAISNSPIEAQWVEGDAATAENSFFKINGNPTTIDPTELDIIKARRKPNAIATRAIIRRATGHKYWVAFDPEKQSEIERLARDIYDLLFVPILATTTIKTLEIPIAGQSYSAEAFNMIFDLVNIFNDVTDSMWKVGDIKKESKKEPATKKDAKPLLADDKDGSETINFLKNVQKIARLISDVRYPGSLGLHPAVYFLSATLKFHPGAFLAVLKFIRELRNESQLEQFTNIRAQFEDFLISHRMFLNQIVQTKGSRTRSLETLVTMYRIIFTEMIHGNYDAAAIVDKLQANPKLAKLTLEHEVLSRSRRRKFSSEAISAGYLNDAIPGAVRCKICGALLDPKSMSADHNVRFEDGGTSDITNLQLTHPYCNTGYKEAKHAKLAVAAKDVAV